MRLWIAMIADQYDVLGNPSQEVISNNQRYHRRRVLYSGGCARAAYDQQSGAGDHQLITTNIRTVLGSMNDEMLSADSINSRRIVDEATNREIDHPWPNSSPPAGLSLQ